MTPGRSQPGTSAIRFWIAILAVALSMVATLSWMLRRAEWRAIAGVVRDGRDREARSIAEVASAVRALDLVTVQLETRVEAESIEQSWRGDVSARVSAPAILHYGVDLRAMDVSRVGLSPVSGAYVVTIPSPERLATEVVGDEERLGVHVGWLRSRRLSGEYHLGLARRGLYPAARAVRLAPEDAQRVRDLTREQVAALVQKIVGPAAGVVVRIDDAIEPSAATHPAASVEEAR